MAKISILVPIYNVECYLRECLDSLIGQTLEDIEIVCINDGSTDNSAQILQEYASKDSRIKVIDKENSGYGASLNRGLEMATAEYIGIVESDDFADSKMFEELVALANKNNADVVKSDFFFYFSKKKQARRAGKISKNKCGKVFSVKDDATILKTMPSIWSAIYKKSFLVENGIRFLETAGASYQDTSFAFKVLATAERIVFTSKAYLYYRSDNENSSVKSKAKVYAICDEWEEITDYLAKRTDIKQVVNDVKLSTQFNAYKWNVIRISEQYRDEFIDRFQADFRQYYNDGEITNNFYKKVRQEELSMLLNDKTAFRAYIDDLSIKQQKKEKRQQQFSIRINPSRVSVVLFGKHILEIG